LHIASIFFGGRTGKQSRHNRGGECPRLRAACAAGS
jgi:hypothetical protein